MASIAKVEVELRSLAGRIDRIRYMYQGCSELHVDRETEVVSKFVSQYGLVPLIWDEVYGCYRLERSIGQLRIVMVYLNEADMEITEYEDICVRSTTDHARQLLASVLMDASDALRRASVQVCPHTGESNMPYTSSMLSMLLQQVQDDPPFDSFQLLKSEDENSELPNFDLALDRVNEELRACMKGLLNGLDSLLDPAAAVRAGCCARRSSVDACQSTVQAGASV